MTKKNDGNLACFQFLKDYLFPIDYNSPFSAFVNYIQRTILEKFIEREIITNMGPILEETISTYGKIKRDNTIGRDFIDGSDAKYGITRYHSGGSSLGVNIRNVHRKKGHLRILVYEYVTKKFYFFMIPHSAYQHIRKSSNIEIPFELNGTPKRSNHWWHYEVKTFADICK